MGFLKIPKRSKPASLPKGLKKAPSSPRKPVNTIYYDVEPVDLFDVKKLIKLE